MTPMVVRGSISRRCVALFEVGSIDFEPQLAPARRVPGPGGRYEGSRRNNEAEPRRPPMLSRRVTMRADHEVSTARIASGDIRYLRAGAGTPLVLLHTLRMQLEYFNGLLEALDTTRLDVIVPDLPGHGRSSAPRVDYT